MVGDTGRRYKHRTNIPPGRIPTGVNFLSLWKTFLRAHGLEVLTLSVQQCWQRIRRTREVPKPVLVNSKWAQICRFSFHLLPVLTSTALLVLNLHHFFVGRSLSGFISNDNINLALLQIAAKIQELLIVASLAMVVTQIVRDELMFGEGIPLGLLASAFSFSQLSYFWSPDFIGSFQCRMSIVRKVSFFGFLVIAGIIAATAGPSCAVLLIPRIQDWPAGGSDFYLPGNIEDNWPSNMSLAQDSYVCGLPNATLYAVCPSGGYYALRAHFTKATPFSTSFDRSRASNGAYRIGISAQLFGLTVESPMGRIPNQKLQGSVRGLVPGGTFMTSPHAATIVLQQILRDEWFAAVDSQTYSPASSVANYRYLIAQKANVNTKNAVVRPLCSQAQVVKQNQTTLAFPVLSGEQGAMRMVGVSAFKKSRTEKLRISWTGLSKDLGDVSIGMIFEAPWLSMESKRLIVTCSIGAWWDGGTTFQVSEGVWAASTNNTAGKSLILDNEWLKKLAPPVPDSGNDFNMEQPSTLEDIASAAGIITGLPQSSAQAQLEQWNTENPGSTNRTTFLEYLIGTVIADGLSRSGSSRLYNTDSPDPQSWTLASLQWDSNHRYSLLRGGNAVQKPEGNFTTLTMSVIITGYSFLASATTDYLSMAVLFAHALIALASFIWTVWKRNGSGCWDTFTEVLVLAQNSRPAAKTLMNTCAGIGNLTTYSRTAEIRATGTDGNGEGKPNHLELVFRDDDDGDLSTDLVSLVPEGPATSGYRYNGQAQVNIPYQRIRTGELYG
ncbi:MAG: hypothetical protein Q9187_002373 [Circinaria calcarea]